MSKNENLSRIQFSSSSVPSSESYCDVTLRTPTQMPSPPLDRLQLHDNVHEEQ